MRKLTTGMIIGGLIGVSSVALFNLDRSDIRRFQKKSKNILSKAETLMHDIKGLI